MPPRTLNLAELDGANGFAIIGVNSFDFTGESVSNAGDVNGDGFDDLIIGAPGAGSNEYAEGRSYVVFGQSNIGSGGSFNLSELDGTDGFIINGVDIRDDFGRSVSNAGDINGDGIGDLIIGAPYTSLNGENVPGESYVIFGDNNIGEDGSIEAANLNGTDGFTITGAEVGDEFGESVSNAGDINGDGIDDLIIGASQGNTVNRYGDGTGTSYVVFGNSNLGNSDSFRLTELDGTNGFVLNGIDVGDFFGRSVSNAGDINGDNIDDLIISAPLADPNGNSSGESYIIFGNNNIGSNGIFEVAQLDGSNGFILNGINNNDVAGESVSSAGDVNGDGIDDLIVGAPLADPNGNDSGESYIIFGNSNLGSSGNLNLSELDGNNGFVINGIDSGDRSGSSVSNAGDINSDGIADLIIGAPNADPNGNGSGESYIIFGNSNLGDGGSFNLAELNDSNGFIVNGVESTDATGRSVSNAGDINGDGIDDVIVGAPFVSTDDNTQNGAGYVVFGAVNDRQQTQPLNSISGNNQNNTLQGTDGNDEINARNGNDGLSGLAGNDILLGKRGNDALDGGAGNDQINGGGGTDTVVYQFDPAGVTVNLDSGSATDGFGDTDSIINVENVIGSEFEDNLTGNAGNNSLTGRNGNDTIAGEGGDDLLTGGSGADTISGGAGTDSFVYLNPNEGGDLITDFEAGTDKILAVSGIFGGGLSAGTLPTESFVFGSSASDANQRFIYDSATGDLFFDVDGNGAASQQLIASLGATNGFSASDIQLL